MKRQLFLALLVVALTQVGLAFTNISNAFNSPQTGQAVKTVDQTRKNIQVLKGLPDSQLFLLMNFVAVSLGVQCNYCHVEQGKDPTTGRTNWVWESDDKPVKHKAREMMRMVLSIKANEKIDFRENSVTCYTCHRGQPKPVSLPQMPLARSGHEPAGDSPITSTTTSPPIEKVFDKYFAAVGGNAASTTKTLVLKGRREASQGRNWPNEITVALPNKFLVVTTTPQASSRQIINGDKGWIVTGTNVRSLSPTEATDATRGLGELFNVIKVQPSQSMKSVGTEKFGDHDSYVIENSTDTKTERYYFDTQTGLLLRKITLRKTVLMPFPEQVDFEDYRDVQGVKLPFIIRYSAIDTFDSWTRTFTEIKRDAAVSESVFAAPAATPQ
ncbi:MAG TPA: c-type cytochrome [Pyrinomonadaceae bacterium]